MNHVKVTIAGMEFRIVTDEAPTYVMALAQELDKKLSVALMGNSQLSVAKAAVLSARENADAAHKAKADADNLRKNLTEVLDENAKLREQMSIGQLRF